MKKGILFAAVVLFGMIGSAVAAEAQTPDALHGNIGITYDTMYVWRGYLVYGHHSAIHPFIDLDFMGTGFGMDIQSNFANGSGSNPDGFGYNNEQRWDYTSTLCKCFRGRPALGNPVYGRLQVLQLSPNEQSHAFRATARAGQH